MSSLRNVTQLLQGVPAPHEETAVGLNADIEDVEVQTDTAIRLGLKLNEFATNASNTHSAMRAAASLLRPANATIGYGSSNDVSTLRAALLNAEAEAARIRVVNADLAAWSHLLGREREDASRSV